MRAKIIVYSRIFLVMAMAAMARTASGVTLVDYEAQALPPTPPWEFISNGSTTETSQHSVFVQDGVLHMIDNALFVGNTLGYLQHVAFDPSQVITVEFRARVLSGRSDLDERAPFEVWLYNGTIRADLSVGPSSITALGQNGELLLNEPINGTDWHVYRYEVDSSHIQWWVDATSVGSAPIDMLIPTVTDTDRRINFMITSAAAVVELDYLIVRMDSSMPTVDIDIKPGSSSNTINPKSGGVIPVAILTTDTFDATTVDPQSVRFGPNGATEAHGRGHEEDVDGDGDLDLVLHFRTPRTGIRCGNGSASLTGQTLDGQAIAGSDSIKTVGCK